MSNELRNAMNRIEELGYHVCNMIYFSEYEICNNEGRVLIDHLSEAQVIQMAGLIR